MILADKIIQLRKKAGWSQEDLAEQLGVSRQSVSKWEGAQSIPDLNKILAMSQLFGVSVDYLVKDEIETAEPVLLADDVSTDPIRRVSMAEANEFLAMSRISSKRIALGVALCILSPLLLIFLGGLQDTGILPIPEYAVAGIGLVVLLVMVAAAVAIFITTGMRSSPYEFLEKEPIETEYGVDGMVKELKKQYADTFTRKIVMGAVLCILAVVPLFASIILAHDGNIWPILGLCLLFPLVAIGVYQFVSAGIIQESFHKLLQEGDYNPDAKRVNKNIGSIYWPIVVAVYLAWSFITMKWHQTWIIWPVAGVLWAGIASIAKRKN